MTPSPLPDNSTPPMPIQPEGVGYPNGTGNPVLDEISTAHANLSPQAQQAIEGAHGMLGISSSHSDPALAASAAPSPELAVPGVSGPRGPIPSLSPEVPVSPVTGSMGGTPMVDVNPSGSGVDSGLLARSVDSGDQSIPIPATPGSVSLPGESELARLRMNGARVNSIHSPVVRGLAKVGDVLGSTFARGLASNIPGTTAHNLQLQDRAEKESTDERASAKNAADVAHTEAQAGLATAQAGAVPTETALHNAQAANYLSEAEARKNPSLKPLPDPVIDPNDTTKTPRIGYHDEKDPTGKVIYGPAVGAKPVAAHQPTNEIEAFLQAPENQGKPVADVLKDFWTNKSKATGEGKLLTPETAGTLNSVWNSLAPKYHLTTDPFRPGMSDSETKHVQDSMNAAIAREQGGQHITIQQQNADTAGKKAQSKEVADAVKPIVTDMNKQFGLAHDQAETAKDAIDALKGGAIGQALATIKSIVAVAGGKGSGVRITQAEINSIAKATGWAGSFENFINSAKGDGKLNATQQKQLTDILNGIRQKATEKAQVLDSTINRLESAESKEEVHKIHTEYRNQVMGSSGNQPSRPKGVPENAQWNESKRQWELP